MADEFGLGYAGYGPRKQDHKKQPNLKHKTVYNKFKSNFNGGVHGANLQNSLLNSPTFGNDYFRPQNTSASGYVCKNCRRPMQWHGHKLVCRRCKRSITI